MLRLLAVALSLMLATAAEAHGHHHRHHAHAVTADPGCNVLWPCIGVELAPRGVAIARKVGIGGAVARYTPEPRLRSPRAVEGRPADCYGIPWCGCFLRHYLGLADRGLNLAANWAGVGRPTVPHAGAVVVWRHHVGIIRSEPDSRGVAVVLSGNDGRMVRERPRSLRGAIAFREI